MSRWALLAGVLLFASVAAAAIAGAYFMIADEYELERASPVKPPAEIAAVDRTPVTVFAAETPDWVREDYEANAENILARLEQGFARKLSARPTVFLFMEKDENIRIGFKGRARSAEVIITLVGKGWASQTPRGLELFRLGLAHEFAHLWQWDSVGTNRAKNMNWINEGVAQAIAAELMVRAGFWTSAEQEGFKKTESQKCVENLVGGSLASADEREATDANYGCGFVIADAVAIARGKSVLAFWREFFAAHQMQEYFEEEDFFNFIRDDTNDAIFTAAINIFVNSAHANPSIAIEQLYVAAEQTRARRELALGQ